MRVLSVGQQLDFADQRFS